MRRSISAASSSSTAASAFSIRLSTSPMPRIREAMRSGWKYSSWSSFSPTETSLIGLPVTALTESAAPPRASPSSFVSTTPSKATRSAKASATRTASWPVIESSTSSTFVGRVASRTAASSSISASSTCRRPAVSRMTVSRPSARAPSRPCSTALTGSERSSLKTGTWIWRPSCSSWSIAAGRCRSAATSPGLRPSLRRCSESFAAAVVLPEPWRPASRITACLGSTSPEAPAPISSASSSCTTFTTCWPGVRLFSTSSPSARSRTRATKSRTTCRLTSASSSARRISRIAREIASSSSLPRLRRSPRAAPSLSERASNTVAQCTADPGAAVSRRVRQYSAVADEHDHGPDHGGHAHNGHDHEHEEDAPARFVDVVQWLVDESKLALRDEGGHASVVFLGLADGSVRAQRFDATGQHDVADAWSRVATWAKGVGATAVYFVAEAKRDDDEGDEEDVLLVTALNADGVEVTFETPYTRDDDGGVDIRETERSEEVAVPFNEFRELWNLPLLGGDDEHEPA